MEPCTPVLWGIDSHELCIHTLLPAHSLPILTPFPANSLLNLTFCVHSCKRIFSGFWFSFPFFSLPCFGLFFLVCIQPAHGCLPEPLVSCVLSGEGEEWSGLGPPQLCCIAVPPHVKTGLPGDQSGASQALHNTTHFCGGSGWLCLLSPVACLAGLVLILTFFEKCQLVPTSLRPGVGGSVLPGTG